jgi:5-hydroxyisourate hydrolase
MNRVSTHVLDTSCGKPVAAVPVRLYLGGRELNACLTDADGRCANLVPNGEALDPGVYRIVFNLTAHFPDGLYPEVSIAFNAKAGSPHYHIPLLISPFGYTTYRGS